MVGDMCEAKIELRWVVNVIKREIIWADGEQRTDSGISLEVWLRKIDGSNKEILIEQIFMQVFRSIPWLKNKQTRDVEAPRDCPFLPTGQGEKERII